MRRALALRGLLGLRRAGISASNQVFADACAELHSFDAFTAHLERNHAQLNSGYALFLALDRLLELAPPAAPAPFLPQIVRAVLAHGDCRSLGLLGRLLRLLRPRDDALLAEALSLESFNLSRTKHLLVKCLLVRHCFTERVALGTAVTEAESIARGFVEGAFRHAPPYSVLLANLLSAANDVFRLSQPAAIALLRAAAPSELDARLLLQLLYATENFERVFPGLPAAPALGEAPLRGLEELGLRELVKLLRLLGRYAPRRQAEVLRVVQTRMAGQEELELAEEEFLQLLLFFSMHRCVTPELYSRLYTHFLERLETFRPETLTRALLAHAHIIRQMHDNINARLPPAGGAVPPELLRRKNSVKGLNEKLVERVFAFAGKSLDRFSAEDLSRLLKAVAVSGYRRRSMFFVVKEVVLELFWRLEEHRQVQPELWTRISAQVCRDISLMRIDEKKRGELYQLAGVEPVDAGV